MERSLRGQLINGRLFFFSFFSGPHGPGICDNFSARVYLSQLCLGSSETPPRVYFARSSSTPRPQLSPAFLGDRGCKRAIRCEMSSVRAPGDDRRSLRDVAAISDSSERPTANSEQISTTLLAPLSAPRDLAEVCPRHRATAAAAGCTGAVPGARLPAVSPPRPRQPPAALRDRDS